MFLRSKVTKIKNQNWARDVLFIQLVALIITVIWFHQGVLYGGGETALYYSNLSLSLKQLSSFWLNSYLGVPSLYQFINLPLFFFANLLFLLNIPSWIIQAIINFILISLGTTSMYFLIRQTVAKNYSYKLLPLFGALFYFFNLYSMSQVWSRGLYQQFIPFGSFPLMFLLAYLSLKKMKVAYILILLLVSYLFSAGFTPSYVLTFWIMMGIIYSYFITIHRRDFKKLVKIIWLFLVLITGWVGIHSFWLVGNFLFSGSLYLSNTNVRSEGLGTLMAVSRYSPLTSVIRLSQDGYFSSNWLYGNFFPSPIFNILSWITPLLFLFAVPVIKKSKDFYLWGILLLISFFICLGASMPLGFIFVLLFKTFPILELFRNPYEKFGIVLMMAYTPFIALGYFRFSEFIGNHFKFFRKSNLKKLYFFHLPVLFIIFVFLVWPMWTGLVFTTKDNLNFVSVPNYYLDLKKWLDQNNKSNSRIAMLPLMPGEGVTLKWGNKTYSGIDPSINILDYSIISWVQDFPYTKPLLTKVYQDIGQTDIGPIFGMLRAKYLVVRDDVVQVSNRDLKQEQNILHSINRPNNIDDQMPIVCKDQSIQNKGEEILILSCPLEHADWGKYHYLHLTLKTNKPAALDIALRDNNNNRPRWDGTVDKNYRTTSDQWSDLTLTLDLPVYGDNKFNQAAVTQLEILVHPNPDNKELSPVKELLLKGGYLDQGKEQSLDNYRYITTWGKLRLYELKKYQDYPEITFPSIIKTVDNFDQMFSELDTLSTIDGSSAYFVSSQNPEGSKFINNSTVGQVKQFSPLKYLVSFQDSNEHQVVLHKTFNPFWKVIPGVLDDDLKGGFTNNLHLLQKATLAEDKHFVVNGYGNSWRVNKGKFAIVFIPQVITEILIGVSLVFVLLITLLLIVDLSLIKNSKKKLR